MPSAEISVCMRKRRLRPANSQRCAHFGQNIPVAIRRSHSTRGGCVCVWGGGGGVVGGVWVLLNSKQTVVFWVYAVLLSKAQIIKRPNAIFMCNIVRHFERHNLKTSMIERCTLLVVKTVGQDESRNLETLVAERWRVKNELLHY